MHTPGSTGAVRSVATSRAGRSSGALGLRRRIAAALQLREVVGDAIRPLDTTVRRSSSPLMTIPPGAPSRRRAPPVTSSPSCPGGRSTKAVTDTRPSPVGSRRRRRSACAWRCLAPRSNGSSPSRSGKGGTSRRSFRRSSKPPPGSSTAPRPRPGSPNPPVPVRHQDHLDLMPAPFRPRRHAPGVPLMRPGGGRCTRSTGITRPHFAQGARGAELAVFVDPARRAHRPAYRPGTNARICSTTFRSSASSRCWCSIACRCRCSSLTSIGISSW